MTRLLDAGLGRLRNIISDMATLSEKAVHGAIEAYVSGLRSPLPVTNLSEALRMLQDETTELAIELIVRYQPVAGDLRFIRSCIEISYGYSRYGRYAYDIVEVLETIGPAENCDKTAVVDAYQVVREMISLSAKALRSLDKDAALELYRMDDRVDSSYREYFKQVVSSEKTYQEQSSPKCYCSTLLILRYLERISDHACSIADSVHYVVTGEPHVRR